MLFGSFDYAPIQDVYALAPIFYYLTFMVVMTFLLLNMMLLIIVDAYAEVVMEKAQVTKNQSTWRALSNIVCDLFQIPHHVSKRIKRVCGSRTRHSKRDILTHGKTGSIPVDPLAEFRALSRGDVVSRGKIRSQLLLKVLEILLDVKRGFIKGDNEAAMTEISLEATRKHLSNDGNKDTNAGTTAKALKSICEDDTGNSNDDKALVAEDLLVSTSTIDDPHGGSSNGSEEATIDAKPADITEGNVVITEDVSDNVNNIKAATTDKPEVLLMAKTLQDWFAGANISDKVARKTIKYIRKGMGESNGSQGATKADPLVSKADNDVSNSRDPRISLESEFSSVRDDGAKLPAAALHALQEAATTTQLLKKIDGLEANVKELKGDIEVMKKNLDFLVHKLSEN